MHELYIAECIIHSVKESLPPQISSERVTQVRVKVGQLDAVVSDSLLFLFDAIKGNNGLPDATLEIVTEDVRCRCRDCSHEFTLELPIFLCPACNSSAVDLLAGRGIMLTGITANDTEDA